jgi:hypothetical protein
MSDSEDFDTLFNEIMATEPKETTATAAPVVEATVTEALPDLPKEVIDTPVAVEVPKQPQKKYQTDDGKVVVLGAPCETMIYTAGYCRFKWVNPKFANQAVLYLDQVEEMEKFFQSEDYKTWKQSAINAGLRKRGEARKES